jgi:hypothetical protein
LFITIYGEIVEKSLTRLNCTKGPRPSYATLSKNLGRRRRREMGWQPWSKNLVESLSVNQTVTRAIDLSFQG